MEKIKDAKNMVAKLFSTIQINGMIKALEEKAGWFEIEKTDETIKVKHIKTNQYIFKALKKCNNCWITRLIDNLFRTR